MIKCSTQAIYLCRNILRQRGPHNDMSSKSVELLTKCCKGSIEEMLVGVATFSSLLCKVLCNDAVFAIIISKRMKVLYNMTQYQHWVSDLQMTTTANLSILEFHYRYLPQLLHNSGACSMLKEVYQGRLLCPGVLDQISCYSCNLTSTKKQIAYILIFRR